MGPHRHPVLRTEGDVFALYCFLLLLLGKALRRRDCEKSNIEGHAQSRSHPRDAITPIVQPSEGVNRRARE